MNIIDSLTYYTEEILVLARAFATYMTNGPSIVPIEGTSLVKIPVWHRGRIMAIYLKCNRTAFDSGDIRYVQCNNNMIDVPVPGLDHHLSPLDLNVDELVVTTEDDTIVVKNTDTISFLS